MSGVRFSSATPMNTKVLKLAKRLISIPSYVGKDSNETKIAKFIEDYCKSFTRLKIIEQPVKNGRFNLILKDQYPTKLLFCAHLDTVQPRTGEKNNPFKPIQEDNKLYGLGASDMKGSIAALLYALGKFQQTKGLMVLFYIDEEYDFLGMRRFIEAYRDKIKPKLIVSADGYDLKLGNGCRGLIEITLKIKGKTGSAANPKNGNNAITGTTEIVKKLTKILAGYKSFLGNTTCNLAFIRGGLDLGTMGIGREGNNIADIVEIVLDIRPATTTLTSSKIINILKSLCIKQDLKLVDNKVRHDLGCWITSKTDLKKIVDILEPITQPKYLDTNSYGYIDTQMLWAVFKVPCITFGAGNLMIAHKPNEFVEIKNLQITQDVYKRLIKNFAKGGEKDGNN